MWFKGNKCGEVSLIQVGKERAREGHSAQSYHTHIARHKPTNSWTVAQANVAMN